MNYSVFDRSKKIALQGIKKYQTNNQYAGFIYSFKVAINNIGLSSSFISFNTRNNRCFELSDLTVSFSALPYPAFPII